MLAPWAAGLLAAGAARSIPSSSIIIAHVHTGPGGVLTAPHVPHHRICHNPRQWVLLMFPFYRKGNWFEPAKSPMIMQPGGTAHLTEPSSGQEQRRHRPKFNGWCQVTRVLPTDSGKPQRSGLSGSLLALSLIPPRAGKAIRDPQTWNY